jgi:hypothetical protein
MPHHSQFSEMPRHGAAVMFAAVRGLTCSICAPLTMAQEEVEAAATIMRKPALGHWRAVDKSKPPISMGAPTPNPCDVYADRQHWFLISEGTL